MPIIYLNGKFVEQSEAALDPLDRGVLLGDGLFETIRCEEGQLFYYLAHLARLTRSARILEIPWTLTNEEFLQICHQVLDANHLGTARLRVTLTRGEMANSPDAGSVQTAPTLILHAVGVDQEGIEADRARGWTLHQVGFPINHRSPLAQIKSTSYLEHLLARREARRNGADEGILLNSHGNVAEGAMTNLFLFQDGRLMTPPVEDGALPGIMRLKIGMISARIGIEHVEQSLSVEEFRRAGEVFATNALVEVMPVVRLGGHVVGAGEPGPIAARYQAEHRRDVEDFLRIMREG